METSLISILSIRPKSQHDSLKIPALRWVPSVTSKKGKRNWRRVSILTRQRVAHGANPNTVRESILTVIYIFLAGKLKKMSIAAEKEVADPAYPSRGTWGPFPPRAVFAHGLRPVSLIIFNLCNSGLHGISLCLGYQSIYRPAPSDEA